MAKERSINMVKSHVIYKDYSKDAERTALLSGENLAHAFGKIARWYTDISWVGHTHDYAGSSTAGGAATSANKLNIGNADIGSETRPVYFNATTGKPVACAYSLNASVPANAVFTDTTYTFTTTGVNNGQLKVTPAGGTASTYTIYTHPSGTAKTQGLYKFAVDDYGHVTNASAVTGSDLPAHTHAYLPLEGGTMTGTLNLVANKYDTECGLDCKNSSIIGVNDIRFNDASQGADEGILFYRSATTWDSIWAANGSIHFTPNYPTDTTAYTVYHSGNLTYSTIGAAPASHTHAASDITSGTLANARLPARLQEYQTTALSSFDTTVTGFYYSGNDTSSPFKSLHSDYLDYMLLVQGYNTNWASQLATDYRSNNIALRIKNSGTWSSWSYLLTNANYSSYVTPAGIGALPTSTKYALSASVGGPALSATAIKLSHGNEVNFSKLTGGYRDIYFGWRWQEADGTESSEALDALDCYHFLKGGGANTYAAIKASEFRGNASSAYRLYDTAITIQTGSSKQAHITMSTLITWLVSQTHIPNNTNLTKVIPVGWSYANNDILQVSINGTSYEIQLAGAIIEFHGYVDTSGNNYLNGVYRFRIHSAPTKSFTPASGYTQFPVSHVAEFFCNGEGYSPTWRMFTTSDDVNGTYVLKSGDTMTGNLKVDTNIWVYGTTRGAILRSDNSHFYILLTDSGSPTSTWNSLRPLYINESTGYVYMHEGVEIVKGLTYVESGSAIMTIKSNNQTDAGVEFIRSGDSYTDFRILNNAGTFRIQCDYTNAHVSWFDVLNISNNVGNMSVRGAGTFGGNIYATGGTMSGNLKIQESKSIMLRTSNDSNYVAGIGYDTQGNECIALWAKNTVTRLRWYAGTDMSDTVYTKMMSITPDFEVSKASGEPWAFVGGVTLDFYKCSLQVDNRENFASYQWHKFAEITTSSGYGDFAITFLFTQTYNDSRNSGILTARLRTNGNCLYQDASLEWHLAGPNIITDNFVLVYTDNSSNSTCKVELWYKQTARYNGYFFKVLRETTRSSRTPYYWTVFNNNDTGSATYTSGTGTKVSTIMNILNTSAKLSTNAGSNTCPVYFSGGVPVACKQVASGAYFSIVPFVRSDGVMDIGRYIDFHTTNASTSINYRIDQWTTDSIEFNSRGTNNRVNIYTPGEGWAQLSFQVSATDKACTASGIRVRPLTNSGTVMQIECSGNMVIGSGESPSTLYSNSYDNLDTSETERLYLASDTEIYFITNAQTYAGVKRLIIDKSGNLKIQQDQHIIQLQNSASNYTSAIKWWKSGTDPGNYGPEIGQHNVGDTDGSICILPYNTSTSPWGGSVGLFISKTRLLYNGTAISLNGHTHSYLPLSGGTLTGYLKLGASDTETLPNCGITIHDIRSVNVPAAGFGSGKLVNFYFHCTDTPNSEWWSIIHMKGWTGAYCAWELAGTAHNGDGRSRPLYVRTSNENTAWGSWRKIYDSSNKPTLSELGAASSSHTHTYLIDPGNSSYKIELAWSGASVPATDTTTYPAVFTKYNLTSGISVRIKESTWDAYKTFLGLGSAAYTASTAYATASHNHDSLYVAKSMIDVSTTADLGLDGGKNAFGYVSGLTKAAWNNNQTDGVIIRQFYNASWKTELFIDYRTGQTSVRGKNNGTFTDWGSFAILKSDGSYWGMCSPSGANNVWIRTTTLGIIPYESGGLGSGHGGIGTSSWCFNYAYIDNIHGSSLTLGSSSIQGQITIQSPTTASVAYNSTNPRIRFSNAAADQNIDLIMNDWDSIRGPASLSVHGNQGGEYLLAPNVAAWDYTNNKYMAVLSAWSLGTTSAVGQGRVIAGNGTKKGTAGNARGLIEIYSEQDGAAFIIAPPSLTTDVTLTLPSTNGTLELVGHTHSYLPLSGGTLTGNLTITETKSILLRPNHSSYTAGIGYDTSGNECIGIWAKNTVTRLRWHAGTDMTTMTSGTMMGITPDFEISKASGTAKGYIAGDSIVTYKILWSGSTSCTARSSTDITLTTAIAANKYRFIKIVWTVSGGTGVSEIRADTLNVINNVSSASGATTANIIQFTISSDGKKLTVGPGTTAITVLQIAGVCVI